ncbi:MAG: family transposase [Solirubrobacterales bacterium]|nr:family transposase [Solirubrobacterales bacterium]
MRVTRPNALRLSMYACAAAAWASGLRVHRERASIAEPARVATPTLTRVPRYARRRCCRRGSGAKRRGKPWRTTTPDPTAARPADLVKRDFTADRPDALRVADFTYLRCWDCLVFFSFVLDAFSHAAWSAGIRVAHAHRPRPRRAAGGAHAPRPGADVQLVHHSDAGSRYTSYDFRQVLDDHGVLASIGSVGDAYDNAMAESFSPARRAHSASCPSPSASASTCTSSRASGGGGIARRRSPGGDGGDGQQPRPLRRGGTRCPARPSSGGRVRSPSSAPASCAISASMISLTISATLSPSASACSSASTCSAAPRAVTLFFPAIVVSLRQLLGRSRRSSGPRWPELFRHGRQARATRQLPT